MAFVWTLERNKRMLHLRYENDWLFKEKKQPWREFHKILRDDGFPEDMTVSHVRKKWSYMYDTYKIAKRTKNKGWKYYKLFEKIYGKTHVLDKYASWNNEWRLKLIICITETKFVEEEFNNLWRTVERAMRCQDLPEDCCVQDMKGLWHHVRVTFNRKHRMMIKKCMEDSDWELYEPVLAYYQSHEPNYLVKLETETAPELVRLQKKPKHCRRLGDAERKEEAFDEFQWSKDITETFIQIRLQNDWLFREKKWAWNDLRDIMIEECGFPKTLSSREICRKWASTYSDYQKAKATKNKVWVYYTLFDLYLGEGSFSLNPILGWQEEWVFNFISARTDLEYLFKFTYKNQITAWREVEKRLRNIDIPLDHSLLDLPEIWTHLLKTYRWKKKFANKGILTEQWPYYEAIAHYDDLRASQEIKKQKEEQEYGEYQYDDAANDEEFEDDMKLFDLKQKLELKVGPKVESDSNQCRSCSGERGCVDVFQQDEDGLDVAHKLRVICGIQIETTDKLPSQICLNCHRELENAYKFRRKCQQVDKELRNRPTHNIKIEINEEMTSENNNIGDTKEEEDDLNRDEADINYDVDLQRAPKNKIRKTVIKKQTPKVVRRKKKKVKKSRYEYYQVCDICGKHTKNLNSHRDMHSSGKFYSCDVCDKTFKFKSGLIIHKAVHNPTPRKTCEVCGKTFHILAQYRRHFVYHANERKYECETCGKRFNTLDILRVHNRIHTDERPFTCSDCGKTFRTAGCVSRHKRIVHRNVKS